jgi:superoxide dismutase, Cu-Zn family
MNAGIPALALFASSAVLAGCGNGASERQANDDFRTAEPEQTTASAELTDPDGNAVGTATLTQVDGTLLISLSVTGLPAGQHGAHIHATGQCTPPDFTSAGDHWNPANMNHGTQSEPPNPHAGDLPNIEVGEDGTGTLESATTGTLARLLDGDGAAIIVHADPDDYTTQPAGNSGARIACGSFQAA